MTWQAHIPVFHWVPSTPYITFERVPNARGAETIPMPLSTTTLCPHCNANLALVGRAHNCITNVANKPITNADSITNDPIFVTNAKVPTPEVQRVIDWRKGNPDRYREYQREYMRKKRRANATSN
jgi:hypothetical protein